jgi:NADP-dependent aldehyde dehydrogenase
MSEPRVMLPSLDPRTGRAASDGLSATSPEELDDVCAAADAAASGLGQLGRAGRAVMLSAMAAELEARRDELVAVADRETGLGSPRLPGELTRTVFQLEFFAEVLREGSYLEATIDHRGETPAGVRPDLRRIMRPRGAVGVFGASNFPFAFSVPGGDTASALAAGCPVVAKAHEAHPVTSRLCHEALAAGAAAAGAPEHTVSLVAGWDAGRALVEHQLVRAVGFTGSLSGGRALADIAAARPVPVPFFGELGAVNAVVVCPDAARTRGAEIAAGLVTSFTLGVGQFCTKPGLLLVPAGADGQALRDALRELVAATSPGVLLSERTADNFARGRERLVGSPGVSVLAEGAPVVTPDGWWASPVVVVATPEAVASVAAQECFGPSLVVSEYASEAELDGLLDVLTGALTATVHATEADELAPRLLDRFSRHVGRVVWNGFPTGVAVAWAMQHGGPYPAATDAAHTSVGAAAIRRWLRPVTFQDVPQALLPEELRDGPVTVPRRVDGVLELPSA